MRRSRLLLFIILFALCLSSVSLTTAQEPTSAACTHFVQRGDTLFRISLRYRVPLSAIAAANNIVNVNLIYAGQTLVIPTANCVGVPPVAPAPGGSLYTVQAGDTLASISARFGVSVSDLIIANNLTSVSVVVPGMRLVIPGRSQTGQPPPVFTPTPARPANCGPGFHQVNCWPVFGGNWDQDSIRTEPIITEWTTCEPEKIDGLRVCSKTGLGFFGRGAPGLPPGWTLSGNILFTNEPDLAAVQANPAFGAVLDYLRALGFADVRVFTLANSDVVPL